MTPEPLRVDEPIPALCGPSDLARIFGCATATVYGWHCHGKLRRFELRRPIGNRKWSGKLIQRWLESESTLLTPGQQSTS